MFQSQKTRRNLLIAAVVIVLGITAGHYVTDMHHVAFHNVYRRLYYLPIVLAAFAHGLKGGGLMALVVSAAYIPHAFFSHHRDPAPTVDKLLEIVLYLVIGLLTGWLVELQRRAHARLSVALTEKEVLEKQLVRAGKLSALGQLTSGLAHEIRNPLASILGSAEAITSEFDEGHRKYPLTRVLLDEISRLDQVVSGFLKFAGPAPPEKRKTSSRELVLRLEGLLRTTLESRKIRLETQVPDEIVELDSDQAGQVLLNLVLNGADAAQSAENPTVVIVFERRKIAGKPYACFGVKDNGEGVPDSLSETIFEPYFTTRSDGSGLGLSISNTIMEKHGGILDLEQGEHTVFWACFPEEP